MKRFALLVLCAACGKDDATAVQASAAFAMPSGPDQPAFAPVSPAHMSAVDQRLPTRCDSTENQQAYLLALHQLCDDVMVNVRACDGDASFRKSFGDGKLLDELVHAATICQPATDAQLCTPREAEAGQLLEWAAADDCATLAHRLGIVIQN